MKNVKKKERQFFFHDYEKQNLYLYNRRIILMRNKTDRKGINYKNDK